MAKNKFQINTETIELTFHNISQYLKDQQWWDSEKKRKKAIKVYKKLKLGKLFNLARQDFEKYRNNIQASLNDWCNKCINKQWKKLSKSIHQAQKQIKAQIDVQITAKLSRPEQEKNISLSNTAYNLLYNHSKKENKSISEIIISLLDPKIKSLAIDNKDKQNIKTIEAIKNTQPDNKELKTREKIKKGKLNVIELWHYAGGQCQALSKVTKKRCKRIAPGLSIKHQIIDGIDYEYAVCHTHDDKQSQLAQSDVNIKSE